MASRGKSQGIQSNQKREVGMRQGTPRREVRPGGTNQLGYKYGTHNTEAGQGTLDYRGQKLYGGAGYPSRLGNEVAENTVCKPGGSRTLYGKSGSQMQYGANAGSPKPQGREILSEYGPDYRAKGSR